jgi:hypothetical protein
MFDIFKKKKKDPLGLTENQRQFISSLVGALSKKYPIFKTELELGTFAWVAPNKVGGEGSYVFGINNDVWQKIADKKKANFLVKNIFFSSRVGEKVTVELYTTEGLIIGFGTSDHIENIDFSSIDISNIWEKYFLNDDYSKISHLFEPLTNEQQSKLNMVKNTFQIDINGIIYYPIHDIEDGNYIAIDTGGVVYKITHDPFQVIQIFASIPEYLVS